MSATWHTNPRHPRHTACPRCGAAPGELCRSKNGRLLTGIERQHRDRRPVERRG